jgi:hypothetical protein
MYRSYLSKRFAFWIFFFVFFSLISINFKIVFRRFSHKVMTEKRDHKNCKIALSFKAKTWIFFNLAFLYSMIFYYISSSKQYIFLHETSSWLFAIQKAQKSQHFSRRYFKNYINRLQSLYFLIMRTKNLRTQKLRIKTLSIIFSSFKE